MVLRLTSWSCFARALVGMQRIAVAAQRADGEPLIVQLLFEFVELRPVIEHGELAVRIAGIVPGAEFHGIDMEACQLLENVCPGTTAPAGR